MTLGKMLQAISLAACEGSLKSSLPVTNCIDPTPTNEWSPFKSVVRYLRSKGFLTPGIVGSECLVCVYDCCSCKR